MIQTAPMKLAVPPEPETPPPASVPEPAPASSSVTFWLIVGAILAAGLFLRIHPWTGFQNVGMDEALYRRYVVLLDGGTQVAKVLSQDMQSATPFELKLEGRGLAIYPDLSDFFILSQKAPNTMCELPPTRFLYIYTSWLWKHAEFGNAPPVDLHSPDALTRDPALVSLHRVAILFSCLGFVVSGLAAWRMLGMRAMPPILALIAFSPLQIHLAQHALIDGVFTFWAVLSLWLLWENLQRPNDWRWLLGLIVSLALMVMTKENSFFVFLGLAGIVAANRWAKFGTVTSRLLLAGVAGPILGVLILVTLAGGLTQFHEIYHLLVIKAQTLTYAIKTGDGPWYRYLVDLLLISPLVLVLAIGGVFSQVRTHRAYVYLVAFVGFSYAIMCNVRYGMNLRYASIWDLPLRTLAVAQVGAIAQRFGSRQTLVMGLTIAALCAYDLRQYYIFFASTNLYELVTGALLSVVKILK